MTITHRRLVHAVASQAFRDDLFYRMNVIHIEVPPLRERCEDVPALFRYFLCVHAARLGRPVIDLTPDALNCLTEYDWPGNVRELKEVAERLVQTHTTSERVGMDESAGGDRAPIHVADRRTVGLDTGSPQLTGSFGGTPIVAEAAEGTEKSVNTEITEFTEITEVAAGRALRGKDRGRGPDPKRLDQFTCGACDPGLVSILAPAVQAGARPQLRLPVKSASACSA